MRASVSTAMGTAIGKGARQPGYFLEIVWPTSSTLLCSFGTKTWDGRTWDGGGFELPEWSDDGYPTRVELADPDNVYRTLFLSNSRDRRVRVWRADMTALASADPVPIFDGYSSKVTLARGRVSIALDLSDADAQFAPREIIGPAIGVNFVAGAAQRIQFGSTVIVLEPRRG